MNTEAIKPNEQYHAPGLDLVSIPARKAIIESATRVVETKIWDTRFEFRRWRDAVSSHWEQILRAESTGEFEREMNALIQRANEFMPVPSTDIGLFHARSRKRPQPKGLAARFRYCQPNECSRAYVDSSSRVDVLYSHLEGRIGWLKIAAFPGAIGIDIANDISAAVQELKEAQCERLILDLRGNASGGLAFLRLMSYLTPDRLVAGYSITRVGAEKGIPKEKLKRFDWVPSRKWALPWLALKFGLSDPSVCLMTEGLGQQPFHGRVAVLVDELTTGAGERVAAFAHENRLATIIGTRTAGKLICSDSIELGHQYFLRIPARVWYTGREQLLENSGVWPDLEVASSGANPGEDRALQKAMELIRGSSRKQGFAGS